jgi:hypothetical protein
MNYLLFCFLEVALTDEKTGERPMKDLRLPKPTGENVKREEREESESPPR